MDPKIIARAAAVILLAGAVLACALELARQGPTLEPSAPAAQDNMHLADELSRCEALGAEAAHDAACKAAWAQNRARFLAPVAPYQDRRSIQLSPATPDAPEGVPKIHLDRAPSTPQSDVRTPSTGPEGR